MLQFVLQCKDYIAKITSDNKLMLRYYMRVLSHNHVIIKW